MKLANVEFDCSPVVEVKLISLLRYCVMVDGATHVLFESHGDAIRFASTIRAAMVDGIV